MTAICVSIMSSQPDDGNCKIVVGFMENVPSVQTTQSNSNLTLGAAEQDKSSVSTADTSKPKPVVSQTVVKTSETKPPTDDSQPADALAAVVAAEGSGSTVNKPPES